MHIHSLNLDSAIQNSPIEDRKLAVGKFDYPSSSFLKNSQILSINSLRPSCHSRTHRGQDGHLGGRGGRGRRGRRGPAIRARRAAAVPRRHAPAPPPHSPAADNPILESLPDAILTAILTYASESELRPDAVIEGALKHFLELDTSLSDEPSRVAEETSLLAGLSDVLQSRALEYAEKQKLPNELVIELAIAHFLDPDSVTFDDCQVRVEQTSITWLKQYAQDEPATAA